MACFAPICYLLHRVMADGSEALLMEPDLHSALADSARAEILGAWRAERITLGHETVLEGDTLRAAIAQAAAHLPA